VTPLAAGLAAIALGTLALVVVLLLPADAQVPLQRRRPGVAAEPGALETLSTAATDAVGRALTRRNPVGLKLALELAGIKMRPQDLVFLAIVGAIAGAAVGLLLIRPWGLVLGALSPLVLKVWIDGMTSRRRSKFADQLDDALQLMSSSLRAGHSLPQALNSVAREAEDPIAEEFLRVMNETRVGRDLSASLDDTAKRMGSEDFEWVVQAIAINREVGGNLAEVLDGVGHTIRERNQIRRQVKALSAEGKLSAYILMGLPFVVALFIFLTNRAYMLKFTESALGLIMLAVAGVMLVVGGFWLRKTVQIKF